MIWWCAFGACFRGFWGNVGGYRMAFLLCYVDLIMCFFWAGIADIVSDGFYLFLFVFLVGGCYE